MAQSLKPKVTWPLGSFGSDVTLDNGRITVHVNGDDYDTEADLMYRALLAARRARRAGVVHL